MIVLQKEKEPALYIQLYEQLKAKIFSGELSENQQMPGMRTMAGDLGVSLNTVKNAYHQLEAEGFVEAKRGIGFFVQQGMSQLQDPQDKKSNWPLAQVAVGETKKMKDMRFDFQYGGIPYDYFPQRKWLSYFRQAAHQATEDVIDDYPHFQGLPQLRKELMHYLSSHRGVECSQHQIVMGSGIHHLLECLCKIVDTRQIFFEEPGYDGSRRVFENNSFDIRPLPADFNQIHIDVLAESEVSLVYVTPSHQFPNGSVLPIQKRIELLQLASEKDAYIIEDDYDSEYRYNSLPIPSLQSIDSDDRVIYMGTFSKTLLPSLRVGYMILPQRLMKKYTEYFAEYQCTVSGTDQQILSYLLRDGEYERHQRRMCNLYRKKHDLLVKKIEKDSPHIKIHGKYAGLHLILEFPEGTDVLEIIKKAKEEGIALYATDPYWYQASNIPDNTLFLGYSTLKIEDIPVAMQILKNIW